MTFFNKDTRTAVEAKTLAQWIAFGPVIFQAARVLKDSGILSVIEESQPEGIGFDKIMEKTGLSRYGVRVLLEAGLGIELIYFTGEKYHLAKTGHFILHDELTSVNINFIHDVCYKGLFHLDKSIENGKPEGLKELGDWNTIYEGLSQLLPHIQKSWFAFDHFFSDYAFPKVLPLVYNNGIKNILDIGGNTGKWAILSARYSPDVHITIMDLPQQLVMARKEIEKLGLSERIFFSRLIFWMRIRNFPKVLMRYG